MRTEDCIDYALGEMRGQRREAFEMELAESADLLESLQKTTDWLETLRRLSRPVESLDPARREFLVAACRANIASRERRAKIIRLAVPFSLAALALFAFLLAETAPRPLGHQTPAANGSVHHEPVLPLDHGKTAQSSDPLFSSMKSSPTSRPVEVKQTTCSTIDVERPLFPIPVDSGSLRHTRATEENPFLDTRQIPQTLMPLSDSRSSYAQIRSDILAGKLPDPATIRIDELINAFTYDFDQNPASSPFAIRLESGPSPWNPGHLLVKIGFRITDTPSPADPDVSSFRDIMLTVRFNPDQVASHRLIGYEKNGAPAQKLHRLTAAKAPFATIALYEIAPLAPDPSDNLLDAILHYKTPVQNICQHMVATLPAAGQNSTDFHFATAVAAFGMKLAGNPEAANIPWSAIEKLAAANLGPDLDGQRADFANLVARASHLAAG